MLERKMNTFKKTMMLLLLSILFNACEEEVIVDSTIKNVDILVSYDTGLDWITFPDNTIKLNDPYNSNNSDQITEPITKMYEYLGVFYFIIPNENRILAVRSEDFKLIAEYNFTDMDLKPTDMCFPNGTDAYVIHKDTTLYSVLDIHNGVIYDHFILGRKPIDVQSSGNKVFFAMPDRNRIDVINVSTREQIDTIFTSKVPILLNVSDKNNELIIVSLGEGKSEYGENIKSKSSIAYVDLNSLETVSTTDLDYGTIGAVDVIPYDIVTTYQEWTYILTNHGILRADNRFKDRIRPFYNKEFDKIFYAPQISSIILSKTEGNSTVLTQLDEQSGSRLSEVSSANKVETILPISN